jgi:serine O-acetyltransferase
MPIRSRADYLDYLAADLAANELSSWHLHHRFRYPVVAWLRSLRRAEYHLNCSRTRLGKLYALVLKRIARNRAIQLGFTIPPNVFGPGLSIPHWGTIVVSEKAIVGARCRIHPGTCIGEDHGTFPAIGDNAYIGPGAKIYGAVVLGDYVLVGANAVVNRSFPAGRVTLVGVPARPSRPETASERNLRVNFLRAGIRDKPGPAASPLAHWPTRPLAPAALSLAPRSTAPATAGSGP